MLNSTRKPKYYEALRDEDTYTTDSSSCMQDEKMLVKKLRWVIFPDNKWIQRWDLMMLILILFMMVAVPYQVGVSIGYYLVNNDVWFSMNVVIDSIFFIDTFLPFYRSYHDERGCLIINLRQIRNEYLRTAFFINLISSLFPSATYRIAVKNAANSKVFLKTKSVSAFEAKELIFLAVSIFKFFRFFRAKRLMTSSPMARKVLESKYMDPYWLGVLRNMFYLFILSHFFACLWSFVAFFQSGTFLEKAKYSETWMALWYNATKDNFIDEPMPLDPFGWKNDLDRYILSLFWAIQTITSIGYGNITPCTFIEYSINSILMLCAGILWAIMIGSLMYAVKSMSTEAEAKTRLHEVHKLLRAYSKSEPEIAENVGKRVKKFVLDQQEKLHHFRSCDVGVLDEFKVYDNLSMDLRRMASYMIYGKFLNSIPYFSSHELDLEERSRLFLHCNIRCFAAGEEVTIDHADNDDKRGIFIVIEGYAFLKFFNYKLNEVFFYLRKGAAYGYSQVLLESNVKYHKETILFPVYSRVLFISRSTVLDTIARNPHTWKNSARWKYLQCLIIHTLRTLNRRRAAFRQSRKTSSFLF